MSIFIIGEIGINHNGDVDIAKELIRGAKDAGADAVKFQKRTIDKVYTKEVLDAPRESQMGKHSKRSKNGLELDFDAYKEIDSECKSKSIDWFASAWDTESQIFLDNLILNIIRLHRQCLPTIL